MVKLMGHVSDIDNTFYSLSYIALYAYPSHIITIQTRCMSTLYKFVQRNKKTKKKKIF